MAGTVAFFPGKYGTSIMRIAFDLPENSKVPPTVFTSHWLPASRNLAHYYPNDFLPDPDRPA